MSADDPYRLKAWAYDRLIEPMQAGVREIAVDVFPPHPGWQVLDVGCGTGTTLARYAEAGCSVVGIDVSPAMLERATARLGNEAELHLTEGGPLPFDDETFDLVVTSMVLHELPAADRSAFLSEMARVARPEGRVLVIDFRFGGLRGWKGHALRRVSGVIERLSGHYSEYRTFRASQGVPGVLERAGLSLVREKIVAGGNIAIYLVAPSP
ncbi:MAG: methyltransferase domain-containing protein [Acidimicrobiia bacterium]|jgi:ubiquinone/menaquinone biosynthesis C-methylase UbiE